MSTKTLLTTEQFERLSEPEVGSYELDQGELIYVSPNDLRHNRVRDRLYIPLREFAARDWVRRRPKRCSSLGLARYGLPISRLWALRKSEMLIRTGSSGLFRSWW